VAPAAVAVAVGAVAEEVEPQKQGMESELAREQQARLEAQVRRELEAVAVAQEAVVAEQVVARAAVRVQQLRLFVRVLVRVSVLPVDPLQPVPGRELARLVVALPEQVPQQAPGRVQRVPPEQEVVAPPRRVAELAPAREPLRVRAQVPSSSPRPPLFGPGFPTGPRQAHPSVIDQRLTPPPVPPLPHPSCRHFQAPPQSPDQRPWRLKRDLHRLYQNLLRLAPQGLLADWRHLSRLPTRPRFVALVRAHLQNPQNRQRLH